MICVWSLSIECARSLSIECAHTIQSERTHCTDRIRPTVVSPYQDEYFMERENPTIGTYCAFRRTLDAHSAIIHSYLSRLAQSVAIVLGVLLVYTLITEVLFLLPLHVEHRHENGSGEHPDRKHATE